MIKSYHIALESHSSTLESYRKTPESHLIAPKSQRQTPGNISEKLTGPPPRRGGLPGPVRGFENGLI
jgi:hypothetical protein